MEYIYLCPGSFCPVTFGHLDVVKRASDIFPEVTVVCSTNTDKNSRWFTEIECRQMWLTYSLPANVKLKTFTEALMEKYDTSRIVMIRGIRGEMDLETENQVMLLNSKKFGSRKAVP